jgi:hypothetical protein
MKNNKNTSNPCGHQTIQRKETEIPMKKGKGNITALLRTIKAAKLGTT